MIGSRRARMAAVGLLVASFGLVAAAGPGSASAAVGTKPPAPTSLRVNGSATTGLTFEWTAPTGRTDLRFDSYQLVATDPAGGTRAGASQTTTGVVDHLAPDTAYTVYVYAIYTTNDWTYVASAASNVVAGTTLPDTQPPEAPLVWKARQTPTSVSLAHTIAADDVGTGVYEVTDGSHTWEFNASQPEAYWTIRGLASNQAYTFRARARDGAGNVSTWSAPVTASIEDQPPTAPANPRVEGADLVWDASTDNSGIVEYTIVIDGGLLYPDRRVATGATSTPLQVYDDGFMELIPSSGPHTYVIKATDPSGNVTSSAPLPVDVP
ncbi:fibronectin type III domain-containing protein [Actinopolymorpha alba]|uniref:fibronectin type III domain-containing protein n=1 Tax=Actinopolymorpha alba TaxID=533267 RepID=UPI0003A71586|nr:fibronectin type III domain-containing protein [Actinopolymorpha alba]